jgi:Taurine catabolism dioxygenase TauD, TfdA family
MSGPPDHLEFELAAGPALWRASDLAATETSVYVNLSNSDIADLNFALAHALSRDVKVAELKPELFPVADFGVRLKAIRSQVTAGCGLCVIRGIPLADYSLAEAAMLLWGIGLHIGRAVPQNKQGELLGSVRDAVLPNQRGRTRGYQTGSALPFHSDSCDVVALFCIAEAKAGGLSSIASTYTIHNAIYDARPELLRSLYEPFYIDRRGEGQEGTVSYYSTPIFMWHNHRLFSRFNPGYIYAAQRRPDTPRLSPRQVEAIEFFKMMCASDHFRFDMTFRPGDLQFLNNNVIVHARSSYEDYREAAKKRHLFRLWLLTLAPEDIPFPMRDRYDDMDKWWADAHFPDHLCQGT